MFLLLWLLCAKIIDEGNDIGDEKNKCPSDGNL